MLQALHPIHVFALLVMLVSSAGHADDKYWKGGDGAWDTTTENWSITSGGTVDQTWNAGDSAIIEGAGGTLTLAADISISELHIAADDFTITSNTLSFIPGGVISNAGGGLVLESGVSGKPDVYMVHSSGPRPMLAPNSVPMSLGTLFRTRDNYMELRGFVAGNTIHDIQNDFIGNNKNAKISVQDSAVWTIENDSYVGELSIQGGTVIAEGVFTSFRTPQCNFSSGVLHYNVPGVLGSSGFRFRGIDLDNSSGGPITTTNGYTYSLEDDLTFIGSQGANSDLTLGVGAVTLIVASPITQNIELTISNAATRLSIGGAIGDGGNSFGLTKSGLGTLELQGDNTYSGSTTIHEGVLDLRVATCLTNSSGIRVSTNGILRLENADHGGSAWDFAALSGLNTNIRSYFEPGSADNLIFSNAVAGHTDVYAVAPPNPDSTAYWDGNDVTGDADGGAGSWNSAASNWNSAATGGAPIAWDANSTSNDTAVFGGSSGTVDLGADFDLRRMEIHTANYKIGSDTETNTLNFAGFEPMIGVYANNVYIKAGINGSPDLHHAVGGTFRLEPIGASMHLGTITRGADNFLEFRGDALTNTVESMPPPIGFYNSNNVKFHKYGTSTWIVNGDCYAGEVYVHAGTLICNGRLWELFRDIDIRGGTLIANETLEGDLDFTSGTLGGTARIDCPGTAVTIPVDGTLAPGFPAGTMTVTNSDCTIDGTLEINVLGSLNGRLVVDPDYVLTLSTNATLNVDLAQASAGTPLPIATYGTLDGVFASINGLDSWDIDYNYKGLKQIALIPPAQGTVLMLR